jgi:type IV pilus assembly protein PilB
VQAKTEKKLGEILLDQNFVTKDQLELGIEQQKLVKKRLGEILTEMGFLTIENLTEALSSQIQKPPINGIPAGANAFAKTKNIGEILLDYHLITKEQLARGVEEQRKSEKRLGEALTDLGFVSEEKLARALSAQLGIPYTDLSSVVVEPEAIDLFKERVARKNLAMPLNVDKRFITVAMADPLDFEAIHDISFATNREVRPTVAPPKEIKAAIRRYYHLSQPLEKILGEIKTDSLEVISTTETRSDGEMIEDAARTSESPPIIRLVNSIVVHAVRNKASDIHFEPREKSVRVRERVDGLLMEAFEFPKLVQGAVTSRVKIMATMDISEKKIPQDGRIKVKVEGRDLDLRVSTLPTNFGEKITIRVLDSGAAPLLLEDMGPTKKDYLRIRSIIERPQGIVLITGPTGSGKSTTLYSMVNHIKTDAINIITLEDPIEYELKGINQVGINEKTGLTFPFALRAVLRQDPDVIMVGEMRDLETAKIAIEASLTGHLVLSTLHTNTAVAAMTRLKNLGITPYLIASSLNGVIAQRLVRKICDKCKEPYTPTPEELFKIKGRAKNSSEMKFYRGRGCPACNDTGYKGRIGVFEVLIVDNQVRELVTNDETEESILKAAAESGMGHMSDDGIDKIHQGITSIEELFRVIHLTDQGPSRVCQNCGESINQDGPHCPHCGFVLMNRCPDCGGNREGKWSFCPYCGKGFVAFPQPV